MRGLLTAEEKRSICLQTTAPAWFTSPEREAAHLASELSPTLGEEPKVNASLIRKVLEKHGCTALGSLAEIRSVLA
jgi:hypothetical protein